MKRLRQIRDYLVENGNLTRASFALHILESEIDPVEKETGTGIHLFDDVQDAVIYIDDVTETQYEKIKLLLYDWFRENGIKNENGGEEETWRLSSDDITDTLCLVTVTLRLVEATHIETTKDGAIERDEKRYAVTDKPTPVGI